LHKLSGNTGTRVCCRISGQASGSGSFFGSIKAVLQSFQFMELIENNTIFCYIEMKLMLDVLLTLISYRLSKLLPLIFDFHEMYLYKPYNISVISWPSVLIGWGNRSTRRKPPTSTSHWQTLSHKVVSSTPRHERDSKSQL